MKYAHIIADVYSRAWAMPEALVLTLHDILRMQAAGVKWSDEEIKQRIAEANAENGYETHEQSGFRYVAIDAIDPQARGGSSNPSSGSVAIIPIQGIISHRMNMMQAMSGAGGTSIQKLQAQFREAMADTNCKAIIFDVDSPGGSVDGVMEMASEIYNGRKTKQSIAVVNSMAASAAYWLASAASEVVITPSGQAGSIGVYMMHQDESEALKKEGIKISLIKAGKYKAEGSPSEPLSDDARAAFQSKVDDFYSMFVKGVAQNRGASQVSIRDGYGQGRTLLANDSVKENLADRVGTFDDVLAKFGVGGKRAQIAATTEEVAPKAEEAAPKADDDIEMECKCACTACVAGNCAQCENDECSDPACGHEPRSKAEDWKTKLNSRRRQLQLH